MVQPSSSWKKSVVKAIKLLKEFILEWLYEWNRVDLYYKPYKTNIIGEHKFNPKTDKKW